MKYKVLLVLLLCLGVSCTPRVYGAAIGTVAVAPVAYVAEDDPSVEDIAIFALIGTFIGYTVGYLIEDR